MLEEIETPEKLKRFIIFLHNFGKEAIKEPARLKKLYNNSMNADILFSIKFLEKNKIKICWIYHFYPNSRRY